MIKDNNRLNKYHAWGLLKNHYIKVKQLHLRELFAEDSYEGSRWPLKISVYT